jgi:GNAT superfamily N-acetyltransferase
MSTPPALSRHLNDWLGRWPGEEPIDVVGSPRREEPGWDGRIFPVIGVHSPDTSVLSVPPADAAAVRKGLNEHETWEELLLQLPYLLGREDRFVYSGVFRYCDRPIAPADLPDAGAWIAADHPSVPDWLRPFGHEVLIAWDPETGAYLAGVGIKHHDRYGQEIAVGTEEAARGRGLARRLVAQATRRILDEGAVATYQHDPANLASAHVADAAGFPDRGWRSLGMP